MKKIIIFLMCTISLFSYSQKYEKLVKYFVPITYKLMKQISPNTGRSPSTQVLDVNLYGNSERDGKFIITFQSKWIAKRNAFSNEEEFGIISNAYVNNGVNEKFDIIKKSNSVLGAWSDSEIASLGALFVGVAIMSNSTDNNSKCSTSNSNSSSSSYTNSNNSSYSKSTCSSCNGRGICTECAGKGSYYCSWCKGKGTKLNFLIEEKCSWCNGTGVKYCTNCNGKGVCRSCNGKGEH